MTKKTFANLHYPGMVVDPKEMESPADGHKSEDTSQRISQLSQQNITEAWTNFLSHAALKKLQAHSTLIIGDNENTVSWIKLLAPIPVKSIGFVSQAVLTPAHQFEEGLLKNLTPSFGSADFDESTLRNTALTQAMSLWVKLHYPSAPFETFSRLHFDQALEDIKKGFDSTISITDKNISIAIAGSVRLTADTQIADATSPDDEIKQLARKTTRVVSLFYEWLHMVCHEPKHNQK